jgi:hypothetical protein
MPLVTAHHVPMLDRKIKWQSHVCGCASILANPKIIFKVSNLALFPNWLLDFLFENGRPIVALFA